MPSSDIYKVKESPQVETPGTARTTSRRRRRRRSVESFDEAVGKDLSRTHQRRRKNSGFRRFRHLMKKPEFSKKFWTIALSVGGLILVLLVLWDLFLRYPGPEEETSESPYGQSAK